MQNFITETFITLYYLTLFFLPSVLYLFGRRCRTTQASSVPLPSSRWFPRASTPCRTWWARQEGLGARARLRRGVKGSVRAEEAGEAGTEEVNQERSQRPCSWTRTAQWGWAEVRVGGMVMKWCREGCLIQVETPWPACPPTRARGLVVGPQQSWGLSVLPPATSIGWAWLGQLQAWTSLKSLAIRYGHHPYWLSVELSARCCTRL